MGAMHDETTVAIRAATPADVAIVYDALLALADHIGSRNEILSTLDDLRHAAFGVERKIAIEIAEIGNAFAGMCIHFPIYSTWMGVSGVFIQDIYVAPAFRGRKIGEALLRHVAKEARAKGGGYLRLSVDADNASAQAFYNRLGLRHSQNEQIHKVTGKAFHDFCEGAPVDGTGERG